MIYLFLVSVTFLVQFSYKERNVKRYIFYKKIKKIQIMCFI